MNQPREIQVECYSGHKYGQRPRVIYLDGERFLIDEVLGEWKTPQGICFRVLVGARIYVLTYNQEEDCWYIPGE